MMRGRFAARMLIMLLARTSQRGPLQDEGAQNMSSPPADEPAHRSGAPVRERARALLGKGNAAIVWAKATPAGILWTRLNAADFINSAFQFATYALLCIFPFMIVVTAAAGGSFRKVSSPGSGWTRRPPGMWTGSSRPGARRSPALPCWESRS